MQVQNQNKYPGISMAGPRIGQYLSEDRNLISNGDCSVDQYNEGGSLTLASGTAVYVVDGVKARLVTTNSAVVTAQRVVDAPPGFVNSIKLTTTTGAALATTDSLGLIIPIEGSLMKYLNWGSATGGYTSFGFWVKCSITTPSFSVTIQNSAATLTYFGNTVTPLGANVWSYVSIPNIAAPTSGTFLKTDGTIGANIFITVASGSANVTGSGSGWQSTTGFASIAFSNAVMTTTGATAQFTGFQFEHGPNVTPYALIAPDRQLQKCRRYLRKSFPVGTAVAQNAGVAGAVTVKNPIALGDPSEWIQFEPPMASSPTIVTYNPSATNANWRDITASSDVTASVDPATTKSAQGVLLATSGTVTTLGDILGIHYTADARL